MVTKSAGVDWTSHYKMIIRKNGIVAGKFKRIDVTVPPLNGDNFASCCDYVTVHREDGQKTELFAKRPVTNPGHQDMIKRLKLFEKEAGFFNIILPKLVQLIESRAFFGPDHYDLDMIPRCVFANEELVMMDNLAKKGYTLLSKVERQDFNHGVTAMKSLAKFHAPSYLLIKEELANGMGNLSSDLMSKYPCLEDTIRMDTVTNYFGDWLNKAMDFVEKILKTSGLKGSDYAIGVISEWRPNVVAEIQKFFTHDRPHVCYVVNHGDYWNNNMMFLLDPKNQDKILHHILVDFQMIRFGTPNLDISYYLFTSVKHEVRQREWRNLLKTYYDSLYLNVLKLNGMVDFTFEDLVTDFRRNFVAGFIFGICMSGSFEAYSELGNLDQVEGDVVTYISEALDTWVKQNPQKSVHTAQELIDMFHEFKSLVEE